MEGRFRNVVLTARRFYSATLVHLAKDFDDLGYGVSFSLPVRHRTQTGLHDSGRLLARQNLICNGPVFGGQVNGSKCELCFPR